LTARAITGRLSGSTGQMDPQCRQVASLAEAGEPALTDYRVAPFGCGRLGGTIDDEITGRAALHLPYSHAATYTAPPNTDVVAIADIDEAKPRNWGERWKVPPAHRYRDYRALIRAGQPHILSITARRQKY
jgi:predicted dehydrogenase